MKKYCHHCKKKQEISIKNIPATLQYKHKLIEVDIDIELCVVCNNEVYNEELERKTDKIVRDKFEQIQRRR